MRKESWRVLEDLYEEGQIKAIGVSNYTIDHLKELLEDCRIKPHVNQVEIHPHYQQKELVKFCQNENIHLTAYSSLGTTVKEGPNPLLTDPIVQELSRKKGLTSAQILLIWALEKGYSVLPKSTNPDHIAENIELEKEVLNAEDMKILDSLEQNCKYAWNAESVL